MNKLKLGLTALTLGLAASLMGCATDKPRNEPKPIIPEPIVVKPKKNNEKPIKSDIDINISYEFKEEDPYTIWTIWFNPAKKEMTHGLYLSIKDDVIGDDHYWIYDYEGDLIPDCFKHDWDVKREENPSLFENKVDKFWNEYVSKFKIDKIQKELAKHYGLKLPKREGSRYEKTKIDEMELQASNWFGDYDFKEDNFRYSYCNEHGGSKIVFMLDRNGDFIPDYFSVKNSFFGQDREDVPEFFEQRVDPLWERRIKKDKGDKILNKWKEIIEKVYPERGKNRTF